MTTCALSSRSYKNVERQTAHNARIESHMSYLTWQIIFSAGFLLIGVGIGIAMVVIVGISDER